MTIIRHFTCHLILFIASAAFWHCGKSETPLGLDDQEFLNGTWQSEDGSYFVSFDDSVWWSGLNEGALTVDEETGTLLLYGFVYGELTRRGDQLEILIVPTGETYVLRRVEDPAIRDSLSSLTRRGDYIAFASNRLNHPEGDIFIYTVDRNAYLDTIYYFNLVIVRDTTVNGTDTVVTADSTLERLYIEPIRALTNRSGLDAMPAWSPDGKRLAFVSNRNGNQSVWIYFLDDFGDPLDTAINNPIQLTNAGAEARDANPTWSPDGNFIAFERRDRVNSIDTLRDIYIIAADNYGETSPASNFTHAPDDDIFNPEWSPRLDVDVILFERRQNGSSSDWDVFWQYVADTTGFVDRNRVTNPNRNGHPTWSPSGRQIAWERNPPGQGFQYDIQIQDVDFTLMVPSVNNNPIPLTNQNDLPGLNRYPTWLPNGNLIAFMRANDIWLIDIGGGTGTPQYRQLLEDGFQNWDIAW